MSVTVAIKTGRLKESVTHDEHGQPKIADVALADREWDANTDLTKAPAYVKDRATARLFEAARQMPSMVSSTVTRPPHETDGSAGVSGATERLKSAQADLAELKFAEAAGDLVPAADVRRDVADMLSRVRTKLLGLPTALKQALPHLTVVDVVLIENEVRAALEEAVAAEGAQ